MTGARTEFISVGSTEVARNRLLALGFRKAEGHEYLTYSYDDLSRSATGVVASVVRGSRSVRVRLTVFGPGNDHDLGMMEQALRVLRQPNA